MGNLKYRGLWFHCLGYLESPYGPWGGHEKYGDVPVIVWKRAIDWMADNGLNYIIGRISPFCKDFIYNDWGYHYILNFNKFPEARVFNKDFVRSNQKAINEIFSYARKKGVSPFIHHYNFCCTVGFAEKHPVIKKKIEKVPYPFKYVDTLAKVYGNVCWNEPVYKEFLISCWDEFFRIFPSAAGVLVTPGEVNACVCEKCCGLGEDFEALLVKDRSKRHLSTILDFVKTFKKTLERFKRKPVVRVWGAEGLSDKLPKGITYVPKYSVFDCVDAGPDPEVNKWVNAGHDVWVSKEITGSENGGVIIWTNPKFFHKHINKIKSLGVSGIMGVCNDAEGRYGRRFFSQNTHMTIFAEYAKDGRQYDEKVWFERFTNHFGKIGKDVFESMKLYSNIVLGVTRVIFQTGEGYTYYYPYHILESRWNRIGSSHLDPPAWACEGIARVKEYVDYLATNTWYEGFMDKLTGDRENPIIFLERLTADAHKGLELLVDNLDKVPAERLEEYQTLIASAELAESLGRYLISLIKARIYYDGVKSGVGIKTAKVLAGRCLNEFDRALSEVEKSIEVHLKLPYESLDFRKMVGMRFGKSSDPEEWGEGAMVKKRNSMIAALKKLKTEFEPLLSNKLWTY